MAAKKVLVTAKDALPEKKISVNKDWMLEWLGKYGTLEDVEWFEKVCADNITTFQSNLPDLPGGQTYDLPDWAKVRAAFLKKFFPGSYPKKPTAKKKYETYTDKLAALKAAKAMERDQVTIDEAPPKKGRK